MGNGEWGMGNGELKKVELFLFLLASSNFGLPLHPLHPLHPLQNPLPNFLRFPIIPDRSKRDNQ